MNVQIRRRNRNCHGWPNADYDQHFDYLDQHQYHHNQHVAQHVNFSQYDNDAAATSSVYETPSRLIQIGGTTCHCIYSFTKKTD